MVNFALNATWNKGLLIRATSIQHTTFAVEKIKVAFQGITLDILTHPHMIKGLKESFPEMEIIPFSRRSSFGIKGVLASGLRNRLAGKKKYDILFLPVENISGTGYENVLAMILLLFPKKIAMCNKVGEIKILNFKEVGSRLFIYYLLFPIAGAMALALALKLIFYWLKNKRPN